MGFSSTNRYTEHMRKLLFMGALLGGITASGYSDVTVVRQLQIESKNGQGAISAQGILQIHGAKSRRETQVVVEGALGQEFHYPLQAITLVSLDKGTVHSWRFPYPNYEKLSFSKWRKTLSEASGVPANYHIEQSWSRALGDSETRIIRGNPCTKFEFEWRFQVQNEEYSRKDYLVRTTLWLTELSPVLEQILHEEKAFQAAYHKRIGGAPLEDLNKLTMEFAEREIGLDKTDLFNALGQGTAHLKQITGYPMASETEWFLVGSKKNKSLFKISSSLESLSQKPLPDSLFSPSRSSFTPQLDEADLAAKLITRDQ
jgi:hypothetical protein